MSIRYDHPRSDWTSKATRSHRFNTRVLGAYLHWPGTPENSLHGESTAQIAARLRGYRDFHVNSRGYKDVAYGAAVDWRGKTWELRGLDHESGANGGTVSNNHGMAIIMLLGDREVPTQAMIDGVLDLLAQGKAAFSTASWVRGHQQSPDAGGQCPGTQVMGLLRAGRFHYRGPIAVPTGGMSAPAAPAVTKDGKLKIDGRQGVESSKALQRFLNSRVKARKLKIDGRLGPQTYLSLQEYLAAPYRDGEISRQSYRPTELGNGIGPHGWKYTGRRSRGSQTVELLQTWCGVEADGIWYEGTTRALQHKLNAHGVGM